MYTPVADALQTATHTTFLSPDGKYYLHNNAGNTFFNYWWQAHGVDALLDAYLRTRNDVYKQRMKNLLLGTRDKNGGLYPTHYYDDMAWLAIASLRAYQNTNDAEYMAAVQALNKAERCNGTRMLHIRLTPVPMGRLSSLQHAFTG
jgi:hypothetical protein